MNRNEDEIAVVETHIVSGVAVEQIVVNVQGVNDGARPADQDSSHTAVFGGTACRVKSGQRCSGAGDSITARTRHISGDEDLIAPQSSGRDVEMGRRTGASPYPGVHLTKSGIHDVLEVTHREIVDPNLPDLRNDDEAFAGYVQGV